MPKRKPLPTDPAALAAALIDRAIRDLHARAVPGSPVVQALLGHGVGTALAIGGVPYARRALQEQLIALNRRERPESAPRLALPANRFV